MITGFSRVQGLCCWLLLSASLSAAQGSSGGFSLKNDISLAGIHGKMDHLAIDVATKRLFLAATANQSIEVVDLNTGRLVGHIGGIQKPQGVAFADDFNLLLVTDGTAGVAKMFRGSTLDLLQTIPLSADADDVRYDHGCKCFYVAHGGEDAGHDYGEVAIIDGQAQKLVTNIRVAGHPEGLVVDALGGRLYANVPHANSVAVMDLHQRQVVQTWPIPDAKKNVPLAMNDAGTQLYTATRTPARVIVFDTGSGKAIGSSNTVGGADDMYVDAKRRQIYVSGSEGFISIMKVDAVGHISQSATLLTGSGAKTSLYVPQLNSIFVVVPGQGSTDAVLKVFAAGSQD